MKQVIKVSAEWCGPCKALKPVFEKVGKMEEFSNAEFKEIDIEDDDSEEIVNKFGIRNVPTILVLDENGELIKKMVGALPENQLISFFRDSLKDE